MKIKGLVLSLLTLLMTMGMSLMPIYAADVEVTKITANTQVGDGQREVYQFVIEVKDASMLQDLSAADFDIVNNSSTVPFDIKTSNWAQDYADDGIVLKLDGNKIIMDVKPFCYAGKYKSDFSFRRDAWEVNCTKHSELSFKAEDVDVVQTQVLDDAIKGKFTYAGLTREYALYVPKDAQGKQMKNVPLVVWNHGGGEYKGKLDDTLVANKGLTAWVDAGYETAVLMIQVSNANYSYGTANAPDRQLLIDQNNALQAALIRQLISEGTVDKDRVYVTGASSGGGATMRFLMQYPELFAGAIACCSMDPIVNVHNQSFATLGKSARAQRESFETIVSNFENAFQGVVYTWSEEKGQMISKDIDTKALLEVPIYFTHAQNDPTCHEESSKAMYQALLNLGAKNNKLTVWTDEEMAEDGISNAFGASLLHWSWVKVFNHNEEGAPMNWLFKQAKKQEVIVQPQPENPQPEKPEVDNNPSEETTQKPNEIDKGVETGDHSMVALMGAMTLLSAGVYLGIRKFESE